MDIHQIFPGVRTHITSVPSLQFIRSGQTEEDFLPSDGHIVNNLLPVCLKHFQIIVILFLASLILFPLKVGAQRKYDIGLFTGIAWYQGDINAYPLYNPGFAAGPIYRYNFHPRTSVRLSAILNNLKGNDLHFQDEIKQLRAASFNSTGIDLAASWEFNFLPYQTAFMKTRYSPYVSAGIGYHIILSSDVNAYNHVTIPFGLGFKFNFTKRLSGGIENTFRKTYQDNIDGIENFSSESKYRLLGNKDWYTFTGFFMSYKIFNFREDCPAYD